MHLWLLPWKWEEDGHASNLLGVPTANTINVEQIENRFLSKLDNKIAKLRTRQLALAA